MEYSAVVFRKQYLTPNVVELVLRLPENIKFSFKAGQYIQLLFNYTFRSYSLVNTPRMNRELVLCIKLIPEGLGGEYVNSLRVGDAVCFRGPYGEFVAGEVPDNILCIAVGVGVAPICSIIQDVLAHASRKQVTLLFGLRHEADIFYYDLFESLGHDHNNFTFIPALSQGGAGWGGWRGRVTKYLEFFPGLGENTSIFICGNQAMVTDARDILLHQGIAPAYINTEIFS